MNIYAILLGICGIACAGYLLFKLTVNTRNGDFLHKGGIVDKERNNV